MSKLSKQAIEEFRKLYKKSLIRKFLKLILLTEKKISGLLSDARTKLSKIVDYNPLYINQFEVI